MIRLMFIALMILLTTGCASVVPTVVKVPVVVPCSVSTPVQPKYAYEAGTYLQVFPMVRDLKGDRELMLGYQTELQASLKACQ